MLRYDFHTTICPPFSSKSGLGLWFQQPCPGDFDTRCHLAYKRTLGLESSSGPT